ncbi:MAG: zinc metalloprotease [Ignavibacteria bacterium]
MKYALLFLLFFGLWGCSDNTIENPSLINEEEFTDMRRCYSHEHLQAQLLADPMLAYRMQEIEDFTQSILSDKSPKALYLSGDSIVIPVVVNVLYKTSAQNISTAQIQSQIDILNKDFQALNSDYNQTPAQFQSVRSGDTKIVFVLETINRKSTTKVSWKTDNSMKMTSKGGLNPTSPTTKLNIWVCNLSGGILGYAQFPGGSTSTDGIVVDDNAFGDIGTVQSPYNKGRTATHEVGHWMNLRHIWGDATCGNDLVSDTPSHNAANYGCPTFPHYSSCSGSPVEMTMNYMDYTDDACMYMFTIGQKNRMRAIFASGGPRYSFGQ